MLSRFPQAAGPPLRPRTPGRPGAAPGIAKLVQITRTSLGYTSNFTGVYIYIYIYIVCVFLISVCPPPRNYIWTLFKVESQTFSSQKKNISSIK